jgi:hypothetical protein
MTGPRITESSLFLFPKNTSDLSVVLITTIHTNVGALLTDKLFFIYIIR